MDGHNDQSGILGLLAKLHGNEAQRGRQFEHICKWFLRNDPEYHRQLRRVWLWGEWPHRWGRDKGIDLIAEDFDAKIWAIQAKGYAPDYSITKRDVDRFLSESSRKVISYRLLIATAAELGHNAREAIEGQEKKAGYLLLSDLKKRNLKWPSSPDKLSTRQSKPRTPWTHQQEAIKDVVHSFRRHERGQLIRACGTGKTLIGLRVAEAMKARRTLVLVPSLSLISQTLREWTADALHTFRFLPVCSDDTVRGEDRLVSHTSELGVPATTNPAEVAEFLRGAGSRVIFSTYQSTPVLAAAYKRYRIPSFDLAIADEAHRCAGLQTGPFSTILHPRKIRARKRLFMTATPRYFADTLKSRADEMGMEVASMDDREVFGPVFHELKFSDAIRRKLLTDYSVVIIGVDDPMYRRFAEEGVFVTVDGKRISDARTLASHIAVVKATKRYDLRRIISFHGRVSRAREFAARFPEFLRWMPKAATPSGNFWAQLICGTMASCKRDAILDRLRELEPPERGLVSNARCLGEGVDVRALDGVAFIDPKESQVDIVQAVGRAIRKAEHKKLGVIILPVYISSDEDEGKVLEGSGFKQVWRVLRALRAHDDRLADELDNIGTRIGRGKRVRAYLPKKITLDLPERLDKKFVDAIYLRTVRSITPPPRLTIEKILQWADKHYQRIGQWPTQSSGEVTDAPGETWKGINTALNNGGRGLPGGSSIAKLLVEHRGARIRKNLPNLTIEQILRWADKHKKRTGRWPIEVSGNVTDAAGETWISISGSLASGNRGLFGGSSLAKLLAERRGARNIQDLPNLTIGQILRWADKHYQRTGQWPTRSSGEVTDVPGETWSGIRTALHTGVRGLPGGSSLVKLLTEHRGVRNRMDLPNLTIEQILKWADKHKKRTGRWPEVKSGKVTDAHGETWLGINHSLSRGSRGLPGGSALAKLLVEHRGACIRKNLPNLTIEQILQWADKHHQRTGRWPTQISREVTDAPRETWVAINGSLVRGLRGLPGGSSLAKLLVERRGVRNRMDLPNLTIEQILKWADKHKKRTSRWPMEDSGEVTDAPGETWTGITLSLARGSRGLPGGSSLAKLLADHRGVRNIKDLPTLTVRQILKWVDKHHQRTGRWPKVLSGTVTGAGGETWSRINNGLARGLRGLPGGSSLAKLLIEHRGVGNRMNLPNLTIEQILKWADKHKKRIGRWPTQSSREVTDAPCETWSRINNALARGLRGLPGGSSIAKLLVEHRGVRNIGYLPRLTIEQILKWADKHHQRTGQWPAGSFGEVTDAPDETWMGINQALTKGVRGFPGGSSLAKLLAEQRGVRNRGDLSNLTIGQILEWADNHHQRNGSWPDQYSGKVTDAEGETWTGINLSLRRGSRGLPGGSSLAKLLDEKRRKET